MARRELGAINAGSMADIAFLLLIFFMLSANFINQTGIKVSLPIARTAQNYENEHLIVYISDDDMLYIDDERIAKNDLKTTLMNKLKSQNNKNVIIKADKKINFGLAIEVMDIAQQAQAEGLIISAEFDNDYE